jgi:hypothetical protein
VILQDFNIYILDILVAIIKEDIGSIFIFIVIVTALLYLGNFLARKALRKKTELQKQIKRDLLNLYLIDKELRRRAYESNSGGKKDKGGNDRPIFHIPIYYMFVLYAKICRYKEDSQVVLAFGRRVVGEGLIVGSKFHFRVYKYEIPNTDFKFEVFVIFTGFVLVLRDKNDDRNNL